MSKDIVKKDECVELELTVEHLLDIYEDNIKQLLNDVKQMFSLYEIRNFKYDNSSNKIIIEIC